MAVDSQRDTFHINRVKPEEIGLLLSAQSYRPEITTAIKQIKKSRKWKPLQSICSEPITQAQSPVYAEKGYPCLKTRNISNLIASKDEVDHVTFESAKRLKRFTVKNQTILMNRSGAGSIGRASIYFGDDEPLINEHLFRIVVAQSYDPAYVCAFLTSWWGERAIEQGISGSTGQLNLSNEHVRDLPVLVPNSVVQVYIGDTVRQAERLRERSTSLGALISSKMQCCFCGELKPKQTRHSRISPERLLVERLESEFYTPLVLWAEEEIKGSQWNYRSLGDLTHRIKDGPGGWGVSTDDYVNSGVPVIRAVNLIDGECNLTDCVFISAKKHQELINHCAKQDSVLLSVRGTIGRAAVFSSTDYEEASLNAAVVTIDCKDEILPHFLAEFLNTEIGKIQTQRIANGAVQLNMNLTETGSNLIVVPPKDFQQVISALRQKRLLMRDYSRKLTTAAKFLVEALIEGDLKESELKAAQEKLRQGDNSLDREILSQLTRKGYNVSGEPPLFPDLDALYEVLKEAETSQEVEQG